MQDDSPMTWHEGGCHCGAVRFEVLAPSDVAVEECNCSICSKSGFLHLIVPRSSFRLKTDDAALAEYRFNTGVARHLFCKACGIKSFYVPRSHPDGFSVNFRCLDRTEFDRVTVRPFDGRHWEKSVAALTLLRNN